MFLAAIYNKKLKERFKLIKIKVQFRCKKYNNIYSINKNHIIQYLSVNTDIKYFMKKF